MSKLDAPICMTAGDDDIDVAKTGIRLVQIPVLLDPVLPVHPERD